MSIANSIQMLISDSITISGSHFNFHLRHSFSSNIVFAYSFAKIVCFKDHLNYYDTLYHLYISCIHLCISMVSSCSLIAEMSYADVSDCVNVTYCVFEPFTKTLFFIRDSFYYSYPDLTLNPIELISGLFES